MRLISGLGVMLLSSAGSLALGNKLANGLRQLVLQRGASGLRGVGILYLDVRMSVPATPVWSVSGIRELFKARHACKHTCEPAQLRSLGKPNCRLFLMPRVLRPPALPSAACAAFLALIRRALGRARPTKLVLQTTTSGLAAEPSISSWISRFSWRTRAGAPLAIGSTVDYHRHGLLLE